MSPDQNQPGSDVRIADATWLDLRGLQILEKECFGRDAWPIWDVLGVLTLPDIIRLKAEAGGKMVGFIGADLRHSRRHAWIVTFGVLPAYQQRGIGSQLLEHCEERIPLPVIKLSVRRSNQPALALYRKFGYQQAEIWPDYYQGKEDALILEKHTSNGG